jgi:hypothetical protein
MLKEITLVLLFLSLIRQIERNKSFAFLCVAIGIKP